MIEQDMNAFAKNLLINTVDLDSNGTTSFANTVVYNMSQVVLGGHKTNTKPHIPPASEHASLAMANNGKVIVLGSEDRSHNEELAEKVFANIHKIAEDNTARVMEAKNKIEEEIEKIIEATENTFTEEDFPNKEKYAAFKGK